jgi:hypothetical protein
MTMSRLAFLMALTLLAAPATATAATKPGRAKGAAVKAPASSTTAEATVAPKGSETAASPKAPESPTGAAKQNDDMTIPSGQEGAVFKSLTVEGEDRVHFEFERPALSLDLDPSKAPGLDWGSARDVLNRTVPDLGAPMLQSSSQVASPYVAHPWLERFQTGAVARFRPEVKGVERWKLTVVDSKGQTVATYEGKGEPPREIAWDGRTAGGGLVVPGLTYSYVLEARDKAGNKRNFVGQGFKVSAYRLSSVDSPVMVFTGRELPSPDPTRPASSPGEREATAPILLEAAGWLNQSPKAVQAVKVTATARTMEQAQTLCALITRQMTPHLLGDPARIQSVTEVQPDAPEGGAVRIAAGR